MGIGGKFHLRLRMGLLSAKSISLDSTFKSMPRVTRCIVRVSQEDSINPQQLVMKVHYCSNSIL